MNKMQTWMPSKESIQKGMDSIFAPCDWYYRIKNERRKEMDIDYKKLWDGFEATYGSMYIQTKEGSPLSTHILRNLMRTWIRNTMLNTKRLMYEYISEHMAIGMHAEDSKHYTIRIFNKLNISANPLGAISISKKDFNSWCKEKEKENESI